MSLNSVYVCGYTKIQNYKQFPLSDNLVKLNTSGLILVLL